ncbi:RNA polymerase factor sigma-54 [Listeria costaricensis]|uniref:RNA polymerase factor sigma-54 n=1 Tax=Listeria costaricensis TaxID=2026604 RepID=UPI000C07FF35|nr:RNA polymerase factor sigma-54 [Listeria costaricensis]
MRLESNFVQKQQQKQTMKLAMTQQLSQSIAMLQFTTADLTAFLEDKALENPLIEVVSGTDVSTDYNYTKRKNNTGADFDWLDQVPDTKTTLSEALKEQMSLMKLTPVQKIIVLYLIESLDEAGYLTADLNAVKEALLVSEAQVLEGLEILQSMEPAGVGARDARECILLQIDRTMAGPEIAYEVIRDYFTLFAEKKWKKISADMNVTLAEIQAVSDYIQTLSPKPGAEFESERVQYVTPDLILLQEGQTLQVSVAKQFQPELRFQEDYYKMMQATQEKDVAAFLKEKTGEFDWLMKGLEQRESTLKRVGKAIVAHQQAFFTQEGHHLEPLTLKDIAEELDVHESTVSRAVNGKYIETSGGVYELKYFFSSGIQKKTADPGEEGDVSSSTIKHYLKEMVEGEDKNKPLSDQKIVDLLAEKNIDVSRRAIAKYRTELKIPASSKRKRFD